MTDNITGPYVSMAFFCQYALQEQDKVISAIRIVDIFKHTLAPDFTPTKELGIALDVVAVLGFKSGSFVGEKTLTLIMNDPSGEKTPSPIAHPAIFQGEGQGNNLRIALTLQIWKEGLYWFDVLLDDECMTRMPLHIIFVKGGDESEQSASLPSS